MLEEYDKQISEQETPAKPEWEPTLKDILKDNEKSALFGKMLEVEKEDFLAGRMTEADLNEADIARLSFLRTKFNSKMEDVSNINTGITSEKMKIYARINPDFEKVIKLLGPDTAAEVYKNNMEEFAITDPRRFEMLNEQMVNYDRYMNGDWKDLNSRLTEELSSRNIDSKLFAKALAIEDDNERNKAIKDSVRKGYKWYQSIGNFVTFGGMSKRDTKELEENKEEVDLARNKLQEYRGEIADVLAYSTSKNELIRGALAKELIGEKQEVFADKGFKEMGPVPTEKNIQESWPEYKLKNSKKWDELAVGEQDKIKETFIKNKEEEYAKKVKVENSGFWGSIFSLFSGVFSSIKKEDLK